MQQHPHRNRIGGEDVPWAWKWTVSIILTNKEILWTWTAVAQVAAAWSVGGGAVGIEFASIFCPPAPESRDVPSKCCPPRILPVEDAEVSAELQKILLKKRIKILTDAPLQNIAIEDGMVQATVSLPGPPDH